jgi:ABC-2 type transport system ATP-binding protein
MIAVRDFHKAYDGFDAVHASTFEVADGEVFGLVGPNGAGKTTTLKALVGLLEPTDGTVRIGGADPTQSGVRERIGFLPEDSPLYEEMTPRSYLRFFADLYDVPRSTADERIDSTLDRLDLAARDRRIGDLSKGMRRKVAIARSLVNDPDLLVYDEPASGLDPLTTDAVLDFVGDLSEDGKTIVLSAHNLYHIERVCDRVAIMNEGRIVARGTVPEIRDAHGDVEYRVHTSVAVPGSTQENGTHVSVVGDMDAVDRLRDTAADRGGSVTDIRTREPSLEEVFLELTGSREA